MVLVTACADANPREGVDFLPLTCDYKENTYASGRIPGGFFKREGKPPEKEVLTSRLIDRPIRPLFPDGWRNETQIIALVHLGRHRERLGRARDYRRVGGAGAVEHPVDADDRRRARRPSRTATSSSTRPSSSGSAARSTSIVAGSKDGIVMVEAGAKEVPEDADGPGARARARGDQGDRRRHRRAGGAGRQDQAAGRRRRRKSRRTSSREVEGKVLGPLADAMRIKDKLENYATVDKVVERLRRRPIPTRTLERKAESEADRQGPEGKDPARRDPRARPAARRPRSSTRSATITIEVGVLPRTHGSCLFTRGETQALVTATLGTADDQQKVETVDGETWKRFMLHYNFPPFSVGEVKFLRGPGRREIGHGALAERSLAPMMPAEENFPYTVRVVSEILESNGSSSMASVCGGSLAMMDAGVPLKAPVAGVAMGLVMNEETGKYAILSDIAGAEDHYGDMDFKVTGTAAGITALQMDIKVARHHDRDHDARRSSRRARAACTSSARCRRRSRSRARTSRRTRRASSRSGSRSTRSATSSDRAAR